MMMYFLKEWSNLTSNRLWAKASRKTTPTFNKGVRRVEMEGEKQDNRLYHCTKCNLDATCIVHSTEGDICIDCYEAVCLAKEGEGEN